MKEAISKFITSHPFLTYWLASSILATIKVIIRGYPKPAEKIEPVKEETIEIDKSNLEEVEVIDETEES